MNRPLDPSIAAAVEAGKIKSTMLIMERSRMFGSLRHIYTIAGFEAAMAANIGALADFASSLGADALAQVEAVRAIVEHTREDAERGGWGQ